MEFIQKRQPAAEVTLTESGGGAFEVTIDGRLAYSKHATGQFPTEAEIDACLTK